MIKKYLLVAGCLVVCAIFNIVKADFYWAAAFSIYAVLVVVVGLVSNQAERISSQKQR